MFGSRFYPTSRRPSLNEMEESLNRLQKLCSEFERKLGENDPIQNEVHTLALYHLWAAFSESMQASGAILDTESEFDVYAFDEVSKFEREVSDRFRL